MGTRLSKFRRGLVFAAACGIVLAAALALLVAPQGSNCGGNSAALSSVKWYALLARQVAEENPEQTFLLAEATPQRRAELACIASDAGISGGRFLVSPFPQHIHAGEPLRLLIVCDRAYRNVPRRVIGSAPPTHAAAFSDGSIRLISIEEFAAIRASLVPLDELLAKFKWDESGGSNSTSM